MNAQDYVEVFFENITNEESEMLIAMLSDCGFEGFEEGQQQLKGYIHEMDFDEVTFAEKILPQVTYQLQKVQSQNWNTIWEENFEPVVVNNFVGVRAHFHAPFAAKIKHEIVITPKMSFGTGHHATTYMMLEQMQHIDFTGKQVLDFGTGTGVLAILSEQLGAAYVLAIDIDEWSIVNAKENTEQNACTAVVIEEANRLTITEKYDVILANINKNVILENFSLLYNSLPGNGLLLISGLLAEDEKEVLQHANLLQLMHLRTIHRQQWIAILLRR